MSADAKRKCVFCGGSANSREHVIAQRLYKRAKADEISIQVGITKENQGTQTRPPHSLDSLKVRMVCKPCNNIWMNNLEEWFENNLGVLIEPSWPSNAEDQIQKIKHENTVLVRWLLKTAVTVNLSSMAAPFFSNEYTLTLKDGPIPPDVYVELANSKQAGIATLFDPGFQIFNGGRYSKNQIHKDKSAFRFTLQFNHLLLRIYKIPAAVSSYLSYFGELPIVLYPEACKQTPLNYSYDDILAFHSSLVIETRGS